MVRHARGVLAAIVVAIGAIPPVAARAQETVNYASVSGRVTDQAGAVIVGAAVSIRQTDTNVAATVASGPDGRFRFAYLRVGPYELTVANAGFTTATRTLQLS